MPVFMGARPVFSAADLAVSRRFYTEKLGFMVADDGDDFFQLERGGATLAVYDAQVYSTPARPGLCAVFVDDVDGVAAAIDTAVRSEVEPHHLGGYRHFTVKDPDGNILIIAQRVD